eukprot:CAMPEP_0172457298 /NCGR_PEP_ID=MMETSP1065-20121228/21207_1 /TAXON_ID=265537 /ORGANISM="Amphiprora paludosa, Strain CCMP125" /LENGTH=248 /DNA_ID=CAMNT_0013210933 /DNA_START=109 /DNA_END=855 /DNA_ORIENTATION=+
MLKFIGTTFLAFLSVSGVANGFLNTRPRPALLAQQSNQQSLHRHHAAVDPHTIIQQVDHLAATSELLHNAQIESLLSTMYATGVAHGHSDPWFGSDPYLAAGKSLVPQGLTVAPPADLPAAAQFFSEKGWNVMDSANMKPEPSLPGINNIGGILPARETNIPPTDNVAVFSAQVEWAANFMNVAMKLPLAAFVYALVEFCILRKNVNLYKSEIEQESQTTLWAETMATVFVRLIAMSVVAIGTLTIFG